MNFEITQGKIPSAQKCVIYGPEGIGKSTFAAEFPEPLFIDTEGSTKQLAIKRLPKPQSFRQLLDEIEYVATNPTICKTLVIDTIDWAEKLAIEDVIQKLKLENGIEDAGYGKGYVYVADNMQKILNRLDDVIYRGINVVLTAHAQLRTFYEPNEMGQYDRWELKVTKKSAPLIKEWADMLLFANYKTIVVTDSKTGKGKGQGGQRVMYTTHMPTYDAKNRFGLAEQLPFDYQSIAHIFSDVQPTKETPITSGDIPDLNTPNTGIVDGDPRDLQVDNSPLAIFKRAIDEKGITEQEIIAYVNTTGMYEKDLPIEKYEKDFLNYLTNNIGKLYSKIVDMRNPLGEEEE